MMFKGAVDCVIDGLDPSDNMKYSLLLYVKNAYSLLCSIPCITEDHKKYLRFYCTLKSLH